MRIAVILAAAGRGSRAGGGAPKQYRRITQRTVLGETIARFHGRRDIETVQCVIHQRDHGAFGEVAAQFPGLADPVNGGDTRQDSVLRGLDALAGRGLTHVLIHDAARPFVDGDVIDRVITGLRDNEGVIPALPLADTLKRCEQGRIRETVERTGLWAAQTPQGFAFQSIHKAHRDAARGNKTGFTDDAAIGEWAGMTIAIVEGSPDNTKITTARDLERARVRSALPDVRTGHGCDVHRFAPDRPLVLCGVAIAGAPGLAGHSDADVGLHALCDALLGALCDGDIGVHFPAGEAAWKDADSALLLSAVAKRVAARRGRITHVDITLICEAPKIGPHRRSMRERVAAILELEIDRVSIKATTTEGLGFAGRGEGIAAQASATIIFG